jgi:hypothetical protein
LRQFVEDGFLQITESGLAVTLKGNPDGTTQALFDEVIGVKKRKLEPPGELATDGGFTGAREAYQADHAATAFSLKSKWQETPLESPSCADNKRPPPDHPSTV